MRSLAILVMFLVVPFAHGVQVDTGKYYTQSWSVYPIGGTDHWIGVEPAAKPTNNNWSPGEQTHWLISLYKQPGDNYRDNWGVASHHYQTPNSRRIYSATVYVPQSNHPSAPDDPMAPLQLVNPTWTQQTRPEGGSWETTETGSGFDPDFEQYLQEFDQWRNSEPHGSEVRWSLPILSAYHEGWDYGEAEDIQWNISLEPETPTYAYSDFGTSLWIGQDQGYGRVDDDPDGHYAYMSVPRDSGDLTNDFWFGAETGDGKTRLSGLASYRAKFNNTTPEPEPLTGGVARTSVSYDLKWGSTAHLYTVQGASIQSIQSQFDRLQAAMAAWYRRPDGYAIDLNYEIVMIIFFSGWQWPEGDVELPSPPTCGSPLDYVKYDTRRFYVGRTDVPDSNDYSDNYLDWRAYYKEWWFRWTYDQRTVMRTGMVYKLYPDATCEDMVEWPEKTGRQIYVNWSTPSNSSYFSAGGWWQITNMPMPVPQALKNYGERVIVGYETFKVKPGGSEEDMFQQAIPCPCKAKDADEGICEDDDCPKPPGDASKGEVIGKNGNAPGTDAQTQMPASRTDVLSRNYQHFAMDYLVAQPDGGCIPCGGESTSYGLPLWDLARVHRYADYDLVGSFGPGVFANHDCRVHLMIDSAGDWVAEIWDPRAQFAIDADHVGGGRFLDQRRQRIAELQLYTGQDLATTTATPAAGVVARVRGHAGTEWRFELTAPVGTGEGYFEGRLIRYANPQGEAITYSYQLPATTDVATIGNDPTALRKLASVQDAYGFGPALTYTRHHHQWVLQQVDPPTGHRIEYAYDPTGLATVGYADGSRASFAMGVDPESGLIALEIQDPGAEGTHRNKTVLLDPATTDGGDVAANRFREVRYAGGELVMKVAHRVRPAEPEVGVIFIERGSGKVTRYRHQQGTPLSVEVTATRDPAKGLSRQSYQQLWVFPSDGVDPQRRITQRVTPTGVRRASTLDASGAVLESEIWGYPDQFSWQEELLGRTIRRYNDYRQPTLVVDRARRATVHEYDPARPWLRTRTIRGLRWDPALDGGAGGTVTTDDVAEWSWTYTGRGQLESAIDANDNVTDYAYYANGLLHTVTEPPDVAGGPRAVTTYAWTAAGLLESVTDPVGRKTEYDYDSRNRLTSATYSDGSAEVWTYVTAGADSNLVRTYRDRNGNLSRYDYDAAGRKVRAAIVADAAGELPVEDRVETWTYVPGTDLVDIHVVDGMTTDYDYDARERLVATTRFPSDDPASALTETTTYDAKDRVFYRTDPYGRRTVFLYDVEDRLVRTVQETVVGALPTLDEEYLRMYLYRELETDVNLGIVITDTSYRPTPDGGWAETSNDVYRTADGRGVVSERHYDWQGRLTDLYRARGTGDPSYLTQITDPKRYARTRYEYDDQGNRLRVYGPRSFDPADTAAFGTFEAYTYTGRNQLASHTRPATATDPAVTESWTYHLDGRMNEHTDFRGAVSTTIYKACCGRLGVQAQPAVPDPDAPGSTYRPVRMTNFDYHGNLTHEALLKWTLSTLPPCCNPDPPDAATLRETTTRYDQRHRPIARTLWLAPLGPVDENAPPIASDPSQGLTTRWEYDDDLTTVDLTLPAPSVVAAIDLLAAGGAGHSAVAVQNPAGEVSVVLRDGLGRTVATWDAEGHRQSLIAYDERIDASNPESDDRGTAMPTGMVVTQRTDAVGSVTRRYTDGLGRTRWIRDAEGHYTVLGYDSNSNRVRVRDPNGVGLDCIVDVLDRDVQCTDTQGDVTIRAYDAVGNVIASTDGRGKTTTCSYDSRDRKVACLDRIGGETIFTYDANDNLESITDAEDGTTAYVYDARDLLVSERYPGHVDSGTWGDPGWDRRDYRYDALGRLALRTDQTGAETRYAYDLAGRLTDRRYDDGQDDGFEYDAASRLVRATSGRYANVVERDYFDDGSLEEERLVYQGITYRVTSAYDAANRRTSVTYPGGGDHWDIGYTQRHQLETLTWNDAAVATVFIDYDPGGREESRAHVNGVTTQRTWRGDNLADTIRAPGVVDFTYAYDANKRKTGETDAVQPDSSQTFGYDDEDRLTSWTRSGTTSPPTLTQTWDLSLVGDWQTTTIDGLPQDRTHNDVHELTAIAGTPLSYDPKGNLTRDPQGQTYAWDPENRLTTATALAQDSGDSATYAYDALGRRIAKTVTTDGSAQTTVFVCDGARVVCEYVDGVLNRSYGYGGYVDDAVVVVDHTQAGSPLYFLHSNHLYSVAAVTDDTGAVVQRYGYDAYGTPETVYDDATDPFEQPYRFTGRRLDAETGLMYFRARYYDSEQGRFIGRDPLGYVDGYTAYHGYFVPGQVDPMGLACPTPRDAFTDSREQLASVLGQGGRLRGAMLNSAYERMANDLILELTTGILDSVPASNLSGRLTRAVANGVLNALLSDESATERLAGAGADLFLAAVFDHALDKLPDRGGLSLADLQTNLSSSGVLGSLAADAQEAAVDWLSSEIQGEISDEVIAAAIKEAFQSNLVKFGESDGVSIPEKGFLAIVDREASRKSNGCECCYIAVIHWNPTGGDVGQDFARRRGKPAQVTFRWCLKGEDGDGGFDQNTLKVRFHQTGKTIP